MFEKEIEQWHTLGGDAVVAKLETGTECGFMGMLDPPRTEAMDAVMSSKAIRRNKDTMLTHMAVILSDSDGSASA